MMGRVRLVAMDLDGTLLGADKSISRENREALRECAQRGIHVVLASGRSFESIRTFAKDIGVDCGILSCNGARMDKTQNGPCLMENCIPEERARQLFCALRELNVYFECYTPGKIYMTDGFVERFHSHQACVMDLDGRTLEYIDSSERMYREALSNAYKFVVFSPDSGILADTAKRMEQFDISITSSWGDNIELMKTGAGKGDALMKYASHLGIGKESIMSFGDQINDLDMLAVSGWPVAMENAVEDLKKNARIIAPHHDLSGVGKVIREYVLDKGETI